MPPKRSTKDNRTVEDLTEEVRLLRQKKEEIEKIENKTSGHTVRLAQIENMIKNIERRSAFRVRSEMSKRRDRSSTPNPETSQEQFLRCLEVKMEPEDHPERQEDGGQEIHAANTLSPNHSTPRDLQRRESTEGVEGGPEIQSDQPSEARVPGEAAEIETTTISFDFQGSQIKEKVSLDFMMFVVFQGVGLENLGPEEEVGPSEATTLVLFEGNREEAISKELAYYLHRNGIHFKHLNAKGNKK